MPEPGQLDLHCVPGLHASFSRIMCISRSCWHSIAKSPEYDVEQHDVRAGVVAGNDHHVGSFMVNQFSSARVDFECQGDIEKDLCSWLGRNIMLTYLTLL